MRTSPRCFDKHCFICLDAGRVSIHGDMKTVTVPTTMPLPCPPYQVRQVIRKLHMVPHRDIFASGNAEPETANRKRLPNEILESTASARFLWNCEAGILGSRVYCQVWKATAYCSVRSDAATERFRLPACYMMDLFQEWWDDWTFRQEKNRGVERLCVPFH